MSRTSLAGILHEIRARLAIDSRAAFATGKLDPKPGQEVREPAHSIIVRLCHLMVVPAMVGEVSRLQHRGYSLVFVAAFRP